ncbi:hypothetical protein [Leptospira santarosai]|uniref:Uncharacterized protein n=1 Tax=Leptospira santarosai serovar Shermani str. LT 821 TaxID=758847 RepID=K8YBZ4_9LEPT|nr:hypothetical protein [Leptospira santarosai]EKT87075.1 hypothetical protein LSS_09424 [Leptospira santarosai serovar Shermani str. LT 821]MDI7235826.1 hypothetical protein [Leptospira santarosai]
MTEIDILSKDKVLLSVCRSFSKKPKRSKRRNYFWISERFKMDGKELKAC